MDKKKVRCFKTYAKVKDNVYNYPVYYLVHEGWANFSLATCLACGELFVIDWDDPKKTGLNLEDIASHQYCPTCNNLLRSTIRNYPLFIRLPNGQIGTYKPENFIPPEEQSEVIELYELT